MADAPGWPGIEARWTSSAKIGVGSALSPVSRVWFTVSHGILNEVYYPRVDQACIRDFGLVVTDGAGFFAEEKRDCSFEITTMEDGVPAFQIVSTHLGGRFRITKRIVTDPRHDVVLQQVRLEVLEGPPLRLFALLSPHLVNGGAHNTAWAGDYKGLRMLFAEGGGTHLAFATDPPFAATSVGFVGVSDGWQILHAHGSLTDTWDRAANGNVALTAEIALQGEEPVHLALGFGRSPAEAAFHARGGLQATFNAVGERYMAGWRTWQAGLLSLDRRVDGHNTYRISTSVLRCHETPNFPGGLIASLSIPWGASKGDDDLGGYHLVWPRDLVQTAGAFLACGAHEEVRRVLRYLRAVQEGDGSWPQNCWLDGKPYWHGLQLDECALPILLVDLAWRMGALSRPILQPYWPMVRAAAGFVVRTGPTTNQDRWEENAGYTPFTLAAEIAGLLAAADLAELCEDNEEAATSPVPARHGGCLGSADRGLALRHRYRAGARGGGGRLLHPRRPAGAGRGAGGGACDGGGAQPRHLQRQRAGRFTDQHRHAGPGALRPARAGRPAHRGQHPGDRPRAVHGAADRPRLAPLQRRRLRRA